jgi:hypothetical protein
MNTKFLTKILGLTAVVALGATALLYKYQNKLIYLPGTTRIIQTCRGTLLVTLSANAIHLKPEFRIGEMWR